MQLSQKIKIFSQFALNFQNLDWIFNILKQKMTFIANVFLSLRIKKKVVR